jgi:hypothetical protein
MSRRPLRPPRLAEWLLTVTVPPEDRDAVLGDLDEALGGGTAGTPRFPRLWCWAEEVE